MEVVFFARSENLRTTSVKSVCLQRFCVGSLLKMSTVPTMGDIWEQERIAHFVSSQAYRELSDIAGAAVVFEWRIYQGHTKAKLLDEVQKMMADENTVHRFDVKGRIIFMSIYNDIDWDQKRNEDVCAQNSANVSAYAKLFPEGCLDIGRRRIVVWDPFLET